MKKSILLLPFALLLLNTAFAQIGIKGGVNIASIGEEHENVSRDDIENHSIAGAVVGLTFGANIGDILTIQPELLYSQSGGRNTYEFLGTETEVSYRFNYLELPVLAKLKLGNADGTGVGFHIAAGPWIGYALNGTRKTVLTIGEITSEDEDDYDFDDEDDAKRINYGLIGAVGFSFSKLVFDIRYNYGLNNLLDDDADNGNDNSPVLQTRGIALTLGYEF